MKKLKTVLLLALSALTIAAALPVVDGWLAVETAWSAEGSGTNVLESSSDGFTAVLKVNRAKSAFDVYITDAKTRKPVTDARVVANVFIPTGKSVVKEPMGMKMADGFSYMSALDLSRKGVYIFNVSAGSNGKKAFFRFRYEVK
ncbi:MAG: hypothetical protein HY890_02615 [Deltaproteobacteria bacterium]|nr:hypothetical protein [Deltaproteobacteria bacterium]